MAETTVFSSAGLLPCNYVRTAYHFWMERWHSLLSDHEHKNLIGLPFDEARLVANIYLMRIFTSLPSAVGSILPHFEQLEDFRPNAVIVESLDSQYFDLEENGDLEGSSHAFSAARFAAACNFLSTAETTDDLLNAMYEAHHATQQKHSYSPPKITVSDR